MNLTEFKTENRWYLHCQIIALFFMAAIIFVSETVNAGVVPANNSLLQFNASPKDVRWPEMPKAPKDAPNILLIMLDDVGFSATSTFGGVIPTPALDKLAADGLRYNRFHTAAVCSASRVALITGRNHHQAGIGSVPQLAAGFPGYNSVVGKETIPVARVLKDNGYNTAAFGKWHINPGWETGQGGSFDRWPTGMGFENYYGCTACLTEWEPRLWVDNTPIPTPNYEGYDMTSDLVNHSIHWIANQKANSPTKPFFVYLAPTATHAPVHAPKEWVEKFRGQFDGGWDKMREHVFMRQKANGIIPKDAKLAARPDDIKPWDELPEIEQKLYSRQMEAYAAYLAYTDHEVGRLLEALERFGIDDNTLVIYIVGDNGASGEGGLSGSITNMAMLQGGGQESIEEQLQHADEFGSKALDLHFAAGWASAQNTPFPWMKQVASHLGGSRNGLVVSWPGHTSKPEAVRSQYSFLTDITATIYDVAGVDFPNTVDGVKQIPLEGKSMVHTFSDPNAPEIRKTQYYTVHSNLGIYHDGWMASTVNTIPWGFFSGMAGSRGNQAEWELYNLEEDFSQAVDLSSTHPEKLEAMIAKYDEEARRNYVYPIIPPFLVGAPTQETASRTEMVYPGEVDNIFVAKLPPIDGRPHTITAKLTAPKNAEGVIAAAGGRYGGFSLYVKEHRLVYTHNSLNQFYNTVKSRNRLPEGELDIKVVITATKTVESTSENAIAARGSFRAGVVTLYVNGKNVGDADLKRFGGMMMNETFDVGNDLGSPVTDAYPDSLAFKGNVEWIKLTVND